MSIHYSSSYSVNLTGKIIEIALDNRYTLSYSALTVTNTNTDLINTTPEVKACRLLKGTVIHAAIAVTMRNPYSGNEFEAFKPVCGKRPPKHSLTYGYAGTREAVTCGKCLAKLNS